MKAKKVLEIWHDGDAMNPFTDWDCEPCVMTYADRHENDYSKGEIMDHIRDKATEGMVIRHQKRIAEILDLDLDYYDGWTKEEKASELNYEIRSANIEQLGELCEVLRIPYKQYTSHGYSQGDWCEVLIVLTDGFFERTGCERKNSESILDGTKELFDNWAWGDVFGFSIVEISTCDHGHKHKDVVDSCGGFYGTDFENNGMMDYVPEELHQQLKDYDYNDIKY